MVASVEEPSMPRRFAAGPCLRRASILTEPLDVYFIELVKTFEIILQSAPVNQQIVNLRCSSVVLEMRAYQAV
jgi:hypothetical protein